MNVPIPSSLDQLAVSRLEKYPGRPTIVFLHDSLGCIDLWKDFPERLSDLTQCNAVVYDRQGYGKSGPFADAVRNNDYMEREADVFIRLLDHWQLDSAILFGHSDGGSIALIAGGKCPERIKGIVTEGAHIFVEEVTLAGIREAIKSYRTTDLKTKLTRYHGEKTEEMFWAWASTWTSDRFRTWNIEHFLPTVGCPALIIQGEEDEFGTLAQVDRIVRGMEGRAGRFVIPGVKHTPHREVPELILKRSAEFIHERVLDVNPDAV